MTASGARELRIAVVGLGPTGVFAIERLIHHGVRARFRRPVRIDAFDPALPGTGIGFDLDQPDYLRLTISADQVDAWYRQGDAPASPERQTFDQWRPPFGPGSVFDTFPPRGHVGHYFAAVWAELMRMLPPGWQLNHQARRVTAISRNEDGRWVVRGLPYDEVVVAVGHMLDWSGALRRQWTGPLPLVDGVFPLSVKLTEHHIPHGASVAIRGAGLTFIDAALALTCGRGGVFEPGKRPYRMRYRRAASGADAAVIYPFSRSGRFLEVKPSPDLIPDSAGLGRMCAESLERLSTVAGDVDAVVDEVFGLARRYWDAGLRLAGADPDPEELRARLREAFDARGRTATELGLDPRIELERSVQVALGERPVGPEWALGRAWRDLQPGLTLALSYENTRARDWPRFSAVAARMEGLAFGPAPINGVRLLALIEGGVVDPRSMVGGATLEHDGVHWPDTMVMPEPAIDVAVDAVMAPPGVRGARHELLNRFIEAGWAHPARARQGLAVDPDGSVIAADGTRPAGLACLGLAAQDIVFGNEALIRREVDVPELWAQRVARTWFGDARRG